MSDEAVDMRIRHRIVALFAFMGIFLQPTAGWSVGEHDGIWLGLETLSIPLLGINETGTTLSVVYQDSNDTMVLARQDYLDWAFLPYVRLVKESERWVLQDQVAVTLLETPVDLTGMVVEFNRRGQMQGSYNFIYQHFNTPYAGVGSFIHDPQTCGTLTPDNPLVNLSDSRGGMRCFHFELPEECSEARITTSGGSGDVDLHVLFSQPEFPIESSEHDADNNEHVLLDGNLDPPGLWYVVLEGAADYTGISLEAEIVIVDEDGDGVSDCDDSCPETLPEEEVDEYGCPVVQSSGAIVPVLHLLLKD